MKKLTLILLTLVSSYSFACKISIAPKVLVINAERLKSNLKTEDCSSVQVENFFNILKNSNGKIHTQSPEIADQGISLNTPSPSIEVLHLQDIINQKYPMKDQSRYKILKTPLKQSLFLLAQEEEVTVKCFNCLEEHTRRLNFVISFGDFFQEKYRFNVELRKVQVFSVYKAIRDIPVFSTDMSSNDFIISEVETENAAPYFLQIKNIPYMKASRTIKKGETLLLSHLSPKSIIRNGQVVKVNLKSNKISLQTQAKALEIGRIDQVIQVKALTTNKVYSARVIAPGETRIDL